MSLVNLFRKSNRKLLFTTPSHAQKFFIYNKFRNFYKYDISETEAHNPQEALLLAESKASKIYGTQFTKFLTNGSSSGIIAAVLAVVKNSEKVLIWDKAHPSHFNAVKLAGAVPVFYNMNFNEEWGVYSRVSCDKLESYLRKERITALIVTSPTYEGFVSDISEIKKLCEKYGTYLIVDEAHGALYPFSERLPESSVNIADFTIQSLHKTAGGLNPTALLHTNLNIDINTPLSLISTTSPSYPLLASVEANINFLNSKHGRNKIDKLIDDTVTLRQSCSECIFAGDDLTKILVKVPGLSGFELSSILFDKYNIEDEITNEKSAMLLCGIGTNSIKIERLQKALISISKSLSNV